ncbi:uncharacterized protein LOC127721508 isoform X2 [Mytilus californianus]|uniref:uncharacterized protein LOC127721508 isoform X2 n=1 Tax=Mytilus californianus TaxID=6549 RepID=UPI002247CFAB|nr:uncharacterized protein LOC127721508 isoform X2 [Mytilus californianus]
MTRLAFILSVLVLVVQVYGDENDLLPDDAGEDILSQDRLYDLMLDDRVCKPHPDNCSKFCSNGHKTGPDGCYTCDCEPFNLKRLLRRLIDKKDKQSSTEETGLM